MTSGSRLTRMAAARPIAAEESFGLALQHHVRVDEIGQLRLYGQRRWARPVTTMMR
jgi:hypothetical protein